ncbi:MAG TPA: tRNA (adenosine(37)-N6)-threonylcarbamoyltransferase complex dimerization subunit type 1 TsaB, partial [Candidatus Omnitrophota bacterium]|nr:tRNA (adenosine(37)-N6)-threonylcarbamoyltransferase complex dimerization subunit type 1 TsaB [Candidatus Omnitrophota bacterium]
GIGPGSFTGLRIGISAIKGLSYSLQKPVYTFSSLEAIAYSCMKADFKKIRIIVDARRSNIYTSLYEKKRLSLKRISEDSLVPFNDLAKKSSGDFVLCGDALETYKNEINEHFRSCGKLGSEFWYPNPEGIAVLTKEMIGKGKGLDSFSLNARYLYEQDCQVKKVC